MQSLQQAMTMTALDLASSFSNGHRALPVHAQALLFLPQEDRDQHGQSPKAQQSMSTHCLGVIQIKLFFSIGEEDLPVPTRREVSKQRFCLGFQVTRSPGPSLGAWG